MKVLFCGGGTAGHVSPAIAIAEELIKRHKTARVSFIGREGGEENSAITKKGYELRTLEIYGFNRKVSLENARRAAVALRALARATRLLKEISPDIVVGTGGYVCWPVIKAAQRMNIPTVIHESNAVAGLATRLVEKGCKKVFLNFEESKKYLKNKACALTVGNPVRKEFFNISRADARVALGISDKSFFILSFGGSMGAERVSDACISLMKSYSQSEREVFHIHAVGRRHYEKIKEMNPTLCKNDGRMQIVPYIEDMPPYLKAADLVICRSGAMTVSELAAASSVAILIPSPNVTDNHQYKNAKLLSDSGAAVLIEETDLSREALEKEVRRIRASRTEQMRMRSSIQKFSVKNAAERIVAEIELLVKKI